VVLASLGVAARSSTEIETGATWFSSEAGKKGQIKVGQLADLVVLSEDYFSVPHDGIADITSVLTLLGGKPVHADAEFKDLGPPRCPIGRPCAPSADTKSVPAWASRAGTLSPPHVDAAIHSACTVMPTRGDCPALLQTIGHSGERSAAPVGHSREIDFRVIVVDGLDGQVQAMDVPSAKIGRD
jgi:hypothetical protein